MPLDGLPPGFADCKRDPSCSRGPSPLRHDDDPKPRMTNFKKSIRKGPCAPHDGFGTREWEDRWPRAREREPPENVNHSRKGQLQNTLTTAPQPPLLLGVAKNANITSLIKCKHLLARVKPGNQRGRRRCWSRAERDVEPTK